MFYKLFGAALAVVAAAWLAGKLFRRWAVSHYTATADLPTFGTSRKDGQKFGTAIICGGSVAGLLTARVCTDHFDQVIIVDPDAAALVAAAQAPDGVLNAPPHSRVMQYEYFHVCQGIFFHGLSKLFGGLFTHELLVAGAHVCPADSNFATGGIYASAQSEKLAQPARIGARLSRAAYETLLRRMVCANKRVQFVDGTILGFDVDPQDPKRLAGVRYRSTGDAKAALTLKGELIIDCSGVSHVGLNFLQRASPAYALPKDILESYYAKIRHSSCTYENATAMLAPYREHAEGYRKDGLITAIFSPLPGMDTRYLFLTQVENDRLKLLTGGVDCTSDINSVAELRAQIQTIRGLKPIPSWMFSILDNLEAQEAEHPGHYTSGKLPPMHWIRYDRHTSMIPVNFIALGDARMRMNPITGQGMGRVMVEAATLDSVLRASAISPSGPAIGPAFFKKAAARTANTWLQLKLADYANASCEPVPGETRELSARLRKYQSYVNKRSLAGDKDILVRGAGVRGWVSPPTDLFAPSVLLKVAMDWMHSR